MKNVRYICLEGGGGRGTVYLGVVKAFEDLGVLPVPRISLEKDRIPGSLKGNPFDLRNNSEGESKILGVSGASAGAITSFLIALGCSSDEISEVIERQVEVLGVERKMGYFDSFLDPGKYYLSPNARNKAQISKNIAANDPKDNKLKADLNNIYYRFVSEKDFKLNFGSEPSKAKVKKVKGSVEFVPYAKKRDDLIAKALVLPIFFNPIWKIIMNGLLKKHDPDPLIQRLTESSADFRVFVRNLIQGEGVFLGAGCRKFFSDMMKEFFIDFYRDAMEEQRKVDPKLYPFLDLDEDVQGAFVTFRDFYHVTGIDFRVTGVNLDDAKPGYFSFVHTPDFPVGEAVAISMCIPGAFKPIIVEGFNRNGRWVDGGALINYPLHAFDRFATNLKGTMPYLEVFKENYSSNKYDEMPPELPEVNPEILGFRLVKSFPSSTTPLIEMYWKYRLKLISRLEKEKRDVNEERLFGLGIIDQKGEGKEVLSESEYKKFQSIRVIVSQLLENIARENRNKITERDSRATERDKMSFKNLLGDIFAVFMYSGGRGQIRANQDEKQTLTLPDFHISTFDFTPERNPRKVLEFIDARNEGRIDGRLHHPIIHAYDETKARVEKGFDNP